MATNVVSKFTPPTGIPFYVSLYWYPKKESFCRSRGGLVSDNSAVKVNWYVQYSLSNVNNHIITSYKLQLKIWSDLAKFLVLKVYASLIMSRGNFIVWIYGRGLQDHLKPFHFMAYLVAHIFDYDSYFSY